MMCMEVHYEDGDEDLIVYRDDTIPTRNGRELGEIWVSKVGTNF